MLLCFLLHQHRQNMHRLYQLPSNWRLGLKLYHDYLLTNIWSTQIVTVITPVACSLLKSQLQISNFSQNTRVHLFEIMSKAERKMDIKDAYCTLNEWVLWKLVYWACSRDESKRRRLKGKTDLPVDLKGGVKWFLPGQHISKVFWLSVLSGKI